MRWLCVLVLAGLAAQAAAQDSVLSYPNIFSDHVEDWTPDSYVLECGPPDGPERPEPADYSCVTIQTREMLETHLGGASVYYQWTHLGSPDGLGPVIDSYAAAVDATRKVVRIFAEPVAGGAAYLNADCGDSPDQYIAIDPASIQRQPKVIVAQSGAHELHHGVFYGATPGGGCDIAEWIREGMADAISFDYSRRHLPAMFPITAAYWKDRATGLRPYNVPLSYDFASGPLRSSEYKTSSLWNFLAWRYHVGGFSYSQDYMDNFTEAHRGDDFAALEWLDAQLKADEEVGMGLYRVFPAFLTDFIGLWDSGDFPESYSRTEWIAHGFNGCETVTVSPADPYKEIDIGVRAMTGRCLTVRVEGLEPQHAAFVKIGAFTDALEISDGLHLGFGFTDDQSAFNCARAARTGALPRELIGCVIEPVTGVFEHGSRSISSARMWLANSVEPELAQQRNIRAGAGIENVYVLSYVPSVLEKGRMAPARPNRATRDPRMFSVKLGIGLEVSELTVDGKPVTRPASDPTRTRLRTKAMGSVGSADRTMDQLVPFTTGYLDTEGVLDDGARPLQTRDPGTILPGLSAFAQLTLTDTSVDPHGLPFNVKDTHPKVSYRVYLEKVAAGQTGRVEGYAIGNDPDLPREHMLANPRDAPAEVIIEENSATVFGARIRATLCEFDLRDMRAGGPRCLREVQVSGRIVKPFAFLYRYGGTLRSIETEGERIYNATTPATTAALGPTGPGVPGTPAPGGGGAGGGGGEGVGTSDNTGACDCACPAPPAADRTGICEVTCATRWSRCAPALEDETGGPSAEIEEPDVEKLLSDAGLPEDTRRAIIRSLDGLPPSAREEVLDAYREQAE